MAIVITVEDGTLVDGANSFVTVQEYRNYWSNRGVDTSGDDDDAVGVLLIKGYDYLQNQYEYLLLGEKVDRDQSLMFPRYGLYDAYGHFWDSNEIPPKVKTAQIVAANKSKTATLMPDLDRGGKVKRTKVDVIEVEYEDNAPALTEFQELDKLMRDFTRSAGIIQVVRS